MSHLLLDNSLYAHILLNALPPIFSCGEKFPIQRLSMWFQVSVDRSEKRKKGHFTQSWEPILISKYSPYSFELPLHYPWNQTPETCGPWTNKLQQWKAILLSIPMKIVGFVIDIFTCIWRGTKSFLWRGENMKEQVIIYGKANWPYTKQARSAYGDRAVYMDVVKDKNKLKEMLKVSNGTREVPVIVDGEKVKIGYGGSWGVWWYNPVVHRKHRKQFPGKLWTWSIVKFEIFYSQKE